MSNEIQHAHSETGDTIYAIVRNSTGQCWNTSGTPAFETQVNANWVSGNYAIAMTESPASGYFYLGSIPAGAVGNISIAIYDRVGASPAVSDPVVGVIGSFAWDGSTASTPDANTASIGNSVTAATALQLMYANAVTTGTVSDASPTATDFDTDLSEASDNHYNDSAIVFTDGVLQGQVRPIDVSLGSGSSGNITVSPAFTEAPGNGDAFLIIGRVVEG